MKQLQLFAFKKLQQPHPMEKLRVQFESLKDKLNALGYVFKYPDDVIGTPDPNIDKKLTVLVNEFGPIPEVLRQFYKIIGSVNFLGSHPEWKGCEYPDPLYVYDIDAVLMELDQWLYEKERFYMDNSEPFHVPIAPDYYHKEEVSGGMFYNVILPNSLSDPLLESEWHDTTFYGYLQICVLWGGFPGLERTESHTWPLKILQETMRFPD